VPTLPDLNSSFNAEAEVSGGHDLLVAQRSHPGHECSEKAPGERGHNEQPHLLECLATHDESGSNDRAGLTEVT